MPAPELVGLLNSIPLLHLGLGILLLMLDESRARLVLKLVGILLILAGIRGFLS